MICASCDGNGFVPGELTGIDATDYREGECVPDVLVQNYLPCPAKCDHGILVYAREIGAHESFGMYVNDVESLLRKLRMAA